MAERGWGWIAVNIQYSGKIYGSFLEDWSWHRIKVAFVSENSFYHTWTDRDSIVWEFKVRNIRGSPENSAQNVFATEKDHFDILESLYGKKSRKCQQKIILCSR